MCLTDGKFLNDLLLSLNFEECLYIVENDVEEEVFGQKWSQVELPILVCLILFTLHFFRIEFSR